MTFVPSALVGAAVALLVAGSAQVVAAPDEAGRRVVVVAPPAVAAQPATQAAVRAAGADLRAPRTATEQLSVTHLFAAQGYAIVGAGLSRRLAVDPVARRYPGVRFKLLPARPSQRALRAALDAVRSPANRRAAR